MPNNVTDEQIQGFVNSVSPEAQDTMRRMLIREGELSGTIDAPTVGDKIEYGWSKVPYTLNKINAWGKDKLTEWISEKGIKDQESLLELQKLSTNPEYYNTIEKQVLDTHERWRSQYGKEMSDLKYVTDKHAMTEYKNVFGTEYENDIPTMVGTLGKFMADPTTLAPLGSGFKAAALIGGSVAAYDNTFHQLYDKGAIDGEELALITALGAVGGGIVAWGGKRLSHWAKNRIDKGEKVTPSELKEMILYSDEVLTDPLTGMRTGAYNVNPRGARSEVLQKALPAPLWEMDARAKQINFAELAKAINRVVYKKPGLVSVDDTPVLDALFKHETKMIADEQELLKIKDGVDKATKQKEMDKAYDIHRTQMSEARSAAAKELKDSEQEILNLSKKVKNLGSSVRKGMTSPLHDSRSIDDYFTNRLDDVYSSLDDAKARIDPLSNGEIAQELAALNRKTDDIAAQLGVNSKDVMRVLGNQGGYANQVLLQHISGAFVGGVAGGVAGDEELAIIGAIAGGFSPMWLPKLFGGVGRLTETALSKEWRMGTNTIAQAVTSPETYTRAMGSLGKVAARKLHAATILKTRIQAKSLHAIAGAVQAVPQTQLAHFIAVMQGVEKPQSNAVRQAAVKTKKMFKEYAKLSRDYGVITEDAYRGMTKGNYWPRIYNERYLESKEGQEAFVRMLSEKGFENKAQGERIVRNLLHSDTAVPQQFVARTDKNGKVSWVLSREAANKVMLKRARASMSKRSTHMDHKRKLHVADEKLLKEFLLDDPMTIITEYGHDVATRLGFAKHFGAADEWIKSLHQSKWGKEPKNKSDLDYITNLYYTALGDSNSSQVAAQLRLSENTKRVLGSINAFETLKLSLAQILNMTQATVNGITFASKHGGGTAVKSYVNGFKSLMTKEGQDFADRTGAALETTIMSMITEGSSHATVLGAFGKSEFTGKLKFLNTLNNPSTFLKHTGFMKIEEIQRKLAANQGKAMFEEALEGYQGVLNGTITGAKAAKIKQKAINITKDLGMTEAHLNPTSPRAMEDILEVAGLEFSNRINHTNNFDRLPPSWRGPYARVALKFKSFMFHQAAFIKDNVMQPAAQFVKSGGKKGSLTPIAAYVGVGTPMGMSTDQIRRMLASDDREFTTTENMLRGITAVGGVGLWLDAANTFVTNPYSGSAYGLIGGPAVSDIFGASKAVTDMVGEASGQPIFRQAIKMTGGNYPGKRYLLDMFRDQSATATVQ